jgi:hypothetical protein
LDVSPDQHRDCTHKRRIIRDSRSRDRGDLFVGQADPNREPPAELATDLIPGWWGLEAGVIRLKHDLRQVDKPAKPPRSTGAPKKKARIDRPEFEKWSDIGIGIDVGTATFYAFEPRPADGAPVILRQAKQIKLRKGQLASVLELFATSTDGRTASDDDLISRLRPRRRNSGTIPAHQARFIENLSEKDLNKYLSSTIANLNRILRDHILVSKNGPPFESQGTGYRAAFVIRRLFAKGGRSTLYFGEPISSGAG